MTLSALDIFSIGIGPSSSHTVGPMRAAARFLDALANRGDLGAVSSVTVHLYGSLAATGRSHGTDVALLLALEGELPDRVDVDDIARRVALIRDGGHLRLRGRHPIAFTENEHLVLHRRERLSRHPNTLRFVARAGDGAALVDATDYSIGGGFILDEQDRSAPPARALPRPFSSGAELLEHCATLGTSISRVMRENERALHGDAELRGGLLGVWRAMNDSIERGMAAEGSLPGYFRVPRRARRLHERLLSRTAPPDELAPFLCPTRAQSGRPISRSRSAGRAGIPWRGHGHLRPGTCRRDAMGATSRTSRRCSPASRSSSHGFVSGTTSRIPIPPLIGPAARLLPSLRLSCGPCTSRPRTWRRGSPSRPGVAADAREVCSMCVWRG